MDEIKKQPYLAEIAGKVYHYNSPNPILYLDCEICLGRTLINMGKDLKYPIIHDNYLVMWRKSYLVGLHAIREKAHAICIENRLLRKTSGTDSHRQTNGRLDDISWKQWLRARARYVYGDISVSAKNDVDMLEVLFRNADTEQGRPPYDMSFKDKEAPIAAKVKLSIAGLLCMWEIGLPNDIACPIIAFAYWIL